jgi:hypothetical protein
MTNAGPGRLVQEEEEQAKQVGAPGMAQAATMHERDMSPVVSLA